MREHFNYTIVKRQRTIGQKKILDIFLKTIIFGLAVGIFSMIDNWSIKIGLHDGACSMIFLFIIFSTSKIFLWATK